MSALDTQVGGNHYREGGIQPIQYIEANSLQFLEASVVKRVTRHNRATGKGRQDIEKAIHELQLLLELRYAEPAAEWPEDEQRIDAIGQNGPTAEHYSAQDRTKACDKMYGVVLTLPERARRNGSDICEALYDAGYRLA